MDGVSEESDTDESQWTVPYDALRCPATKSSASASPTNDEQEPQEGSADLHTTDCPFCSCLIHVKNRGLSDPRNATSYIDFEHPTAAEAEPFIFHGECQPCSSTDRAQISLCGFCKHLRLGHLVRCLWRSPKPPELSNLREVSIDLDPRARALSRTKCDLCDLLTNAISLPQTGLSEVEITLPTSATLVIDNRSIPEITCRRGNSTDEYPIRLDVNHRQAPTNTSVNFEQFVQWDLLRRWLLECKKDHRPECAIRSRPAFPPGFSVIDVKKRCVVEKEGLCKYMALSYVWGKRSQSASYLERSTRDNIESLKLPGALAQLPETVEDAIEMCHQLGIKYLWVDRYCIVQDDNIHKHAQIAAMADIYSCSTVTVIACSGNDGIESGIPGVRRKRQWKRRLINIRGLTIRCNMPSLNDLMRLSIWNTRGWTYQEAILSRRKLIMTPLGTWFRCQVNYYREDNKDPYWLHDNWRSNLQHWAEEQGKLSTLGEYKTHVRKYTARTLGHHSDIYNAFDGIAHALYAEDYAFHYGLPESQFDQALLWYCNCRWHYPGSSCPRICEQTTPSWSWGSVTCGVKYDSHFSVTLLKWVSFEAQTRSESPEIVEPEISEVHCKEIEATDPPLTWRSPGPEESGTSHLYLALAMREEIIKPCEPWIISENDDFKTLLSRIYPWPSTYADACREIRQIGARPSPPRTKGTLFTQAQSAFFHIESGWIQNNSGIIIGGVCQANLPGFIDDDTSNYDGHINHEVDRIDEECNVEGIALSISVADDGYMNELVKVNNPDISLKPDFRWDELQKELYQDLTYIDCKDQPLFPLPKINIMFVSREKGYARRIGLGWIVMKQWSFFDWTLKDIWLK